MPGEVMWVLAGSVGLVVMTSVAWQTWCHRQPIGGVLGRVMRWWIHDWWNYDAKGTNSFGRNERRSDMAVVTVTERAADELQNILTAASAKEDQMLRLVPQPGGGFGLALDKVREGDEVVEAAGQSVLVIASSVAAVIDGAVIDAQETEEGIKLTISR